jgi:hypothetical protein
MVHAQTAEEMDILLNSPQLNYALAARFVLTAAGVVDDGEKEVDAFREALSRNWIPQTVRPSDAITLSRLSLLIMRSFNLRGGLFYRLFHSPRYAYREMVYKKCIQGRTAPGQTLSGEQFILILGRTLTISGVEE